MKKHLSSLIVGLGLVVSTATMTLPVAAQGVNVFDDACKSAGGGSGSSICGPGTKPGDKGFTDLMKSVINTMIFIIGLIAVIMIIIGGIRYVVSNGESSQIQSAKNTVLYSVVGLVIAISAFAIVNFVLDKFK